MVFQKYAWEFGGWDLFCISCLGVGVWSGGERGAGELWGLIVDWPPKSIHPTPTMRWCHWGDAGVWEFTIRVLGLIKHRWTQTPTQWKDNVTHSASCEGGMSCLALATQHCVCLCVWLFEIPDVIKGVLALWTVMMKSKHPNSLAARSFTKTPEWLWLPRTSRSSSRDGCMHLRASSSSGIGTLNSNRHRGSLKWKFKLSCHTKAFVVYPAL